MIHIGVVLHSIRQKHKLTQVDFSKKLGISRSFLSEVESGKKTPSVEQLEGISNNLGIPLPILFLQTLNIDNLENYRSDLNKEKIMSEIRPSIKNIESHFEAKLDLAEVGE